MTNLVFLEPDKIDSEPFTTSDVIADRTGNSYRSIQRTIERQMKRLESFGRVRFEITPLETMRATSMREYAGCVMESGFLRGKPCAK